MIAICTAVRGLVEADLGIGTHSCSRDGFNPLDPGILRAVRSGKGHPPGASIIIILNPKKYTLNVRILAGIRSGGTHVHVK